jgi:hypothetical protein
MHDDNESAEVRLDFEIDAEVLEESRQLDPVSRDMGDLLQILFAMPITLEIGGAVILDRLYRPIVYVAQAGLETLELLPKKKRARLVFPYGRGLQFRMQSETEVSVQALWRGPKASTDYTKLWSSWVGFERRVKAFLLSEFPGYRGHREVGPWLASG